MTLNLPEADYPEATPMQAFHTGLLESLTSIPGVEHAGGVNWAPLGRMLIKGDFKIEGVAQMPRGYILDKMTATPGYFRTLGIQLLHGRDFTAHDDARAPRVVVISRSVAERFWPPHGAAAIGKRLTGEDDPKPEDWLTIVGVVDDVAQQSLTNARGAAMYTPVLQTKRTFFLSSMTFAVRTQRAPTGVMRAMRTAVWELDPDLPIPTLATMRELVDRTIAEPRFEARLLAVFSLLALLLAAIGTYGVLAHDVTSRTHEIGLRMALGAKRADIVVMVLGRALWVAAPGVLLGISGALAFTRVLSSSLFEVKPSDPVTFGTVAAVLFAVALLAAVAPTRRAMRVHPLVALRQD